MQNFVYCTPTKMIFGRDVGIDESRISEMAHHIAVNEGLDQPYVYAPLTEKDIEEILTAAL